MKFNTDINKVKEQIALAKAQGEKAGLVPVVTVNKLKATARKVFYGFHYERKNAVSVGNIQKLEDGSVRKVLWTY